MKIVTTGDAIVITSDIKLDALKAIAKGNPKALTIMGGEEGKEPIFAVSIASKGSGSISAMGAQFAPKTNNSQGYATITLMSNYHSGNIKNHITEEYGAALTHLKTLESVLPDVAAKLAEEKKAIMDSIVTQ